MKRLVTLALAAALVAFLSLAPLQVEAAEGRFWMEGNSKAELNDLTMFSRSLAKLAQDLRKAVVQVGILSDEGLPSEHPPQPEERPRVGSGFFISKDGYLLTNHHVIAHASEIEVELFGGKRLPAKLIGRDSRTDVALLKVDPEASLPVLPLGDSEALEVGELVLAIGNPFGLEYSVTMGVVSRKGRGFGASGPFDEFIQTDATINPGNSGGPLVNLRGEVVGINTAVIPNRRVGFAIPINLVKALLPELRERGKVGWGFLGVTIQDLNEGLAQALGFEGKKGALVNNVLPGKPAEAAGVRRGDVIIAFDGKAIEDVRDLQRTVGRTPVGKEVKVQVFRQGKVKELLIKVGEFPEPAVAATAPPKKDLGLVVEELDTEKAKKFKVKEVEGLIVTEVAKGSPAARGGVRPGDLIKEVNRREVTSLEEYNRALAESSQGIDLFLVQRGEAFLFIAVKAKG